jgi:hypothetical protein
MPTKYLLTGSIWSVVSSNNYLDPASGTMVSGETVLQQVFDLTGEKPWVLLLVGLAFAIGIRLQHLGAMYMHLRKLGRGTTAAVTRRSESRPTCATVSLAVQNIPLTEVSAVFSKFSTASPRRSVIVDI